MDKKTILAFALIIIIYLVSSQYIWKNNTDSPIQNQANQAIKEQSSELSNNSQNVKTNDNEINKKQTENIETIANENIPVNNNIVLENDDMILTFSNHGAKIKDITLKNFYFTHEKKRKLKLLPENSNILGLDFQSNGQNKTLDNHVFKFETLTENNQKGLIFFLENNNQKIVKKSFYLDRNGYNIDFKIKFNNFAPIKDYQLKMNSGIVEAKDFKHKDRVFKVVSQINNDLVEIENNKLNDKDNDTTGAVSWAAVKSKYFTMGIIPEARITASKIDVFKNNETPAFNLTISNSIARTMIEDTYQIYAGPINIERLEQYQNGFEEIADMGFSWLRPISNLFLKFLLFLKKFIPNFGICIIIMAIVLKIVLYPLTHKSLESTQKLKKINPYMKEIQTKYKDDPKQMQIELRKLYKEHGVSPLGGCLPMLVQMPVLISLYPVLRSSILLRQQPFMLWIKDLSNPDPYLILPILMGIFMFLQQKMMAPSKAEEEKMDEKQKASAQSQKIMMYAMPLILFFVFKSFPAGLVLYWLFYNILTVAQQFIIKKKIN